MKKIFSLLLTFLSTILLSQAQVTRTITTNDVVSFFKKKPNQQPTANNSTNTQSTASNSSQQQEPGCDPQEAHLYWLICTTVQMVQNGAITQTGSLKKPVKQWIGVQVNNRRVVGLNLGTDYNGHSGDNLVGEIPQSIGKLSSLNYLNLHVNQISGDIPDAIGNLVNLRQLDLSSNQLSGAIPASLGNLSNLKYLYLDYNKLSGEIPATIGNLPNLRTLVLGDNQLSGIIPSSLFNLKLTSTLELTDNSFNYDGLEEFKRGMLKAGKNDFWCEMQTNHAQREIVHINQKGNRLYVYAGGTLTNNTYYWKIKFSEGKQTKAPGKDYTVDNWIPNTYDKTVQGDSSVFIAVPGTYSVVVLNAYVGSRIELPMTFSRVDGLRSPPYVANGSIQSNSAITLTKATTLDAKSVTVYFDQNKKITANKSVTFQVYRSSENKINDSSIPLSDKPISVIITPQKHQVTLLSGVPLTPDTRLPYIVVEATCSGVKSTTYFRKWMLGAIAHGFDRFAMDGGFWWKNTVQSFKIPKWETDMAENLKNKDLDGYDDVIAFDWMRSCGIAKPYLAVRAGADLALQIWQRINEIKKNDNHPGDVVDLHLIGHSRGTVVVAMALKMLSDKLKMKTDNSAFGGSYIQLTLLDPHPANNNLEEKWGSWELKKNDAGIDVDCFNYPVPNILVLPSVRNPASGRETITQFPNVPQHPPHFEHIDDSRMIVNFVTLYGAYLYNYEKLGNIEYGNKKDYFLQQNRYCRVAAMDSTIDFQTKASDAKLNIPSGINKLEIWFQHTPAYNLYSHDYQEFMQNLWGMVSSATISFEDKTIVLKPINLTNQNIDGIGIIGHGEMPAYYEKTFVDKGTLNRTKAQ